jgi:hypothetical protein
MQQYRSHFRAQRRGILVGDLEGLGEARVAIWCHKAERGIF